jgi:hypothetical protein
MPLGNVPGIDISLLDYLQNRDRGSEPVRTCTALRVQRSMFKVDATTISLNFEPGTLNFCACYGCRPALKSVRS